MNENTDKAAEEPVDETEEIGAEDMAADQADAAPETDDAEAAPQETSEQTAERAAEEEQPGDLEAELADAKDKLLRALAEAENVRRRAARDVENATKRSIAGFAREMIVVADNLDRALGAMDADQADSNEAIKGLITGVEMTAREMQNAFERSGITKVDPLGEKFDPQQHEAMFEYEDASKPAGSVGQVMEVGYALHGQPLRPAKVGVTKGGPKETAAPAPSEQTLKEAEADAQKTAGGNAYEDQGKPSGTNLDQEL